MRGTGSSIAICGALRSGKDTVGQYLVDKYGYARFAFADEMKRISMELFPDEFAEGLKPRSLLQWFGETMRQRDKNVWVRKCFEKIANTSAPAVITDLRLPIEYDRCRSEGYVIIRVNRPDSDRLATAAATDNFDGAAINHETESYVDGFAVDYEIVNDGTLGDLKRKVDEVMTDINGKRLT